MLDPWIIEEIRRREEEKSHNEGRRLELPLEAPNYEEQPKEEREERGVTVIDL